MINHLMQLLLFMIALLLVHGSLLRVYQAGRNGFVSD
jgi:hypothetical protein